MSGKDNVNDKTFSDEVFNTALAMSLEWGENFGKPIGKRLRAAHPEITEAEAEMLHRQCRAIESEAFALIEEGFHLSKGQNDGTAMIQIKQKYPQLNKENLARLYSQGMYYAWHG